MMYCSLYITHFLTVHFLKFGAIQAAYFINFSFWHMTNGTERKHRSTSQEIKDALASCRSIEFEQNFLLTIPDLARHMDHMTGLVIIQHTNLFHVCKFMIAFFCYSIASNELS